MTTVVQNGLSWVSGSSGASSVAISPSGDATGATDTAAITAAASAAATAGGGIIQLYAATYYISTPLPVANGVQYVGVAPQLNYTTNTAPIPDSNLVIANGGGTILQAVGSTACFQWNKTALGTPASAHAFTMTALNNIGLKNLCLNGFTRAVDGGNTNNGACWWSEFEDLYISDCTDWGVYLVNWMHCKFRRIFTFACTTGGQYYANDVAQNILQPGNSIFEDLYNNTMPSGGNLSRGIVFWGVQGVMDEVYGYRIQGNRNNASTVTQAATMANTSANISITDGTKFAVNMPVAFSATANGFTQNQIYFVTNVAANVITVSNTVGGSNVTATGATAVNCITQGFACLEVIAAAGAQIYSFAFSGVDIENGGTAALVLQNVLQSAFDILGTPSSVQSTQTICCRSVTYTQFRSQPLSNTDFDSTSTTGNSFYGNRATGSVQRNPPGFYFDQATGQNFLNFSASVLGLTDSTAADATHIILPQTGFGLKVNQFPNATGAPAATNSGINVVTYAAGTTAWTLPTITSSFNGVFYMICNPTANNCTLNSAAAQYFNNNGALTALVLAPRSGVIVAPIRDANSFYWAVFGIGGTYSAGTITGF